MPEIAILTALALGSLGSGTKIGWFLCVLGHPRNPRQVQPMSPSWSLSRQKIANVKTTLLN